MSDRIKECPDSSCNRRLSNNQNNQNNQNNAWQGPQQPRGLRNNQNIPQIPRRLSFAQEDEYYATHEPQIDPYSNFNSSGPSNMPSSYFNQNPAKRTVSFNSTDENYTNFCEPKCNASRQNYPRGLGPNMTSTPVRQRQPDQDFFYGASSSALPACCRPGQDQNSSYFPSGYPGYFNRNPNDTTPYSYMSGPSNQIQNDYSFMNDTPNQNRNNTPYSFMNAPYSPQPYQQNPNFPCTSPCSLKNGNIYDSNNYTPQPTPHNTINQCSDFDFSGPQSGRQPRSTCPMGGSCTQSNAGICPAGKSCSRVEIGEEPFEFGGGFELDPNCLTGGQPCHEEDQHSKASQESDGPQRYRKTKIPKRTPNGSNTSHPGKTEHRRGSNSKQDDEEKNDQLKADSINMLSVVISTVLLLAADLPNIPENYSNWSVKYLKCIKNKQGQFPANVKKILAMLSSEEEMNKLLQSDNNCACPHNSDN